MDFKYASRIDYVILSSNYSHTGNIGWQDVTGFSLPMLANTDYRFEFEIIFQTSATNKGIGFALNSTATPNLVVVHSEIPTSLTAVTQSLARAFDSGSITNAVDAANSNCYGKCYGFISNGATAGNLILRINKNNNGGTSTVMANSVMKMWRTKPEN